MSVVTTVHLWELDKLFYCFEIIMKIKWGCAWRGFGAMSASSVGLPYFHFSLYDIDIYCSFPHWQLVSTAGDYFSYTEMYKILCSRLNGTTWGAFISKINFFLLSLRQIKRFGNELFGSLGGDILIAVILLQTANLLLLDYTKLMRKVIKCRYFIILKKYLHIIHSMFQMLWKNI